MILLNGVETETGRPGRLYCTNTRTKYRIFYHWSLSTIYNTQSDFFNSTRNFTLTCKTLLLTRQLLAAAKTDFCTGTVDDFSSPMLGRLVRAVSLFHSRPRILVSILFSYSVVLRFLHRAILEKPLCGYPTIWGLPTRFVIKYDVQDWFFLSQVQSANRFILSDLHVVWCFLKLRLHVIRPVAIQDFRISFCRLR